MKVYNSRHENRDSGRGIAARIRKGSCGGGVLRSCGFRMLDRCIDSSGVDAYTNRLN